MVPWACPRWKRKCLRAQFFFLFTVAVACVNLSTLVAQVSTLKYAQTGVLTPVSTASTPIQLPVSMPTAMPTAATALKTAPRLQSITFKPTNLKDNDEATDEESLHDPCVRFAMTRHTSGGLGHRFSEVIMGMRFAQETNSVYVFDDHTAWTQSLSIHGEYPWMKHFLPLQETELTKTDLQSMVDTNAFQTKTGQWDSLVKHSQGSQCDVIYIQDLRKCCKDPHSSAICYCTLDAAKAGSYEDMKGRLRHAFSKSDYEPQNQLSDLTSKANHHDPVVSIAWHIRVGDIVLNAREEYTQTLASQIAEAFHHNNRTAHVNFFAEGGDDAINRSFPFIHEICQNVFHGNCSFPTLDVRDTLYRMIHSDVLVTSGSSFSAMAGCLRTDGLTLAAIPKEGVRSAGIYEISEHVMIDKDGNILDKAQLKRFLEY